MNHSTAQHRLVKDILWNFILETSKNKCSKCGEDMCRKTFTIEHIVPWLHSENPLELFFDLDNITFSHLSCNISAGRRPMKKFSSRKEQQKAYYEKDKINRKYCPEKRRQQYLRTKS